MFPLVVFTAACDRVNVVAVAAVTVAPAAIVSFAAFAPVAGF
jgi:hypothetical protein